MGFSSFLNKLTGGTLSTTAPTQATQPMADMQPQPITDVAAMPSTPIPDPVATVQPELAAMPQGIAPEPPSPIAPIDVPTPAVSDAIMQPSDPLPQPAMTDTMPNDSIQPTVIEQPAMINTATTDLPQSTLIQPTNPIPTPIDLTLQLTRVAENSEIVEAATSSISVNELAADVRSLSTTISIAFNTINQLSQVLEGTPTNMITSFRKTYDDALNQIGRSKSKEALDSIVSLLLEHIEAELYNYDAYKDIPPTYQSTFATTVNAFSLLIAGSPDMVPQEYMSILSEVQEVLENLKTQNKELTAYEKFDQVYTSLSDSKSGQRPLSLHGIAS